MDGDGVNVGDVDDFAELVIDAQVDGDDEPKRETDADDDVVVD